MDCVTVERDGRIFDANKIKFDADYECIDQTCSLVEAKLKAQQKHESIKEFLDYIDFMQTNMNLRFMKSIIFTDPKMDILFSVRNKSNVSSISHLNANLSCFMLRQRIIQSLPTEIEIFPSGG